MGRNCRLIYHPETCSRHYQGYTTRELSYMCYWYGNISSREIALALGRTQKSILNKVERLRRNGQFDAYTQMYDRG